MFADVALAQRIDSAAGRFSPLLAAIVRASAPAHEPFVVPVAGGVAVFAKAGSPANKVIGAGITTDLTADALGPIEAQFDARGEPVRVELSSLAKPEVGALLTARGYRLQGFENVLGLDLRDSASLRPASGPASASAIAIERTRDGEIARWHEILVDGFVVPDATGVPGETYPREAIEDVTRDFSKVPGVDRYIARIGGEAAGAASMRIDDGIAEMSGAATLAAFRKRGVQQALLERRLDDAREAGGAIAVITTSPGTRSQQNAERRGFRLLYVRAVLVRPAPPASG